MHFLLQRVWHGRLLSDPDYLVRPPEARSVHADRRWFAGRKGADSDTGMIPAELVGWHGRCPRRVASRLLSICRETNR